MSDASHLHSDHGQSLAPTLTEVVEAWESGPVPLDVDQPAPAPAPPPASLNEDQIVQRVLLDLQRQIDLMLEYRVREALIPALTRATDALVLEARNELASTLRGIVAKSVAQELARHRKL
jgi:hypothetical protein